MLINRVWAMQKRDTFQCPPIRDFVVKYTWGQPIIIDPFARNNHATYTNDLDPNTKAEYHLEAREFLSMLIDKGIKADVIIIDPPYSQVQVSRTYNDMGREYKPFGDDNNAVIYRQVRDLADKLLNLNGMILSFGWNSVGMGKKRGYSLVEILLVCHGAAHNDTICIAERKLQDKMRLRATALQ